MGLSRSCFLVTPSLRLRLSQKPKANGAPTLIFVAGSALRVADVVIFLLVVSLDQQFTKRLDEDP